eukprot:2358394-Rhodomonas_salina.1
MVLRYHPMRVLCDVRYFEYTVSGTWSMVIRYLPPRMLCDVRYCPRVWCFAIGLRARYTMSGADIEYSAPLSAYA